MPDALYRTDGPSSFPEKQHLRRWDRITDTLHQGSARGAGPTLRFAELTPLASQVSELSVVKA